jgi:hypothetical protein
MTILRLDANARCEDALAAIDRDGAVVIDRLVSPKLMDQIASELRPWLDRTPAVKTNSRDGARSVRGVDRAIPDRPRARDESAGTRSGETDL